MRNVKVKMLSYFITLHKKNFVNVLKKVTFLSEKQINFKTTLKSFFMFTLMHTQKLIYTKCFIINSLNKKISLPARSYGGRFRS